MNFVWMNLEQPFADRDVIVDLAPHFFDMVNFIFDDWPEDNLHWKTLSTEGAGGSGVHIM